MYWTNRVNSVFRPRPFYGKIGTNSVLFSPSIGSILQKGHNHHPVGPIFSQSLCPNLHHQLLISWVTSEGRPFLSSRLISGRPNLQSLIRIFIEIQIDPSDLTPILHTEPLYFCHIQSFTDKIKEVPSHHQQTMYTPPITTPRSSRVIDNDKLLGRVFKHGVLLY